MGTPVIPISGLSRLLLPICLSLIVFILPASLVGQRITKFPFKVPKYISVVVRDYDTDNLLSNSHLSLIGSTSRKPYAITNTLGYAQLPIRRIKDSIAWVDGLMELSYTDPSRPLRGPQVIKLNPFIKHYELYTAPTKIAPYNPDGLTADIHLQTSLRIHNLFAKQLYIDRVEPPESLNWYISYKKRSTLHRGRWYETGFDTMSTHQLFDERRKMMRNVLTGMPTSCKGNNNTLKGYTQATYPHLKLGKVALSFNPITPIEKGVSNSWFRRFANSMVTGLAMPWLNRVNNYMSHWENFELEYNLMMKMSNDYNHFPVRFYSDWMDLNTNETTIVNCAEGGHLLHGPLMGEKVKYPATRPLAAARNIAKKFYESYDEVSALEFASIYNYFARISNTSEIAGVPFNKEVLDEQIDIAPEKVIVNLSDSLLLRELLDNVDKLKDTLQFKIWMLNISHHTYNYMFGHAVAFDQGGGIGGFLSEFMHNSHTSNEHYDTWRRMYYNITEPTYFGRKVMKSLVTRNDQGHRILVDLKHCNYSTRKWYLDSIIQMDLATTGTLIPPVCSHCAANGQKEIDYSKYSDEFKLRNAPFARIFYPFELNLYNEEITRIFQADGLIGIKLEERGLGGYLNKYQIWQKALTHSGEFKRNKRTTLARRYNYVKRWLHNYHLNANPILYDAIQYIRVNMGVSKRTFKILESDYISIEPFLQNLFYFIDHSGKRPIDAFHQLCIGSDLDGIINPIEICPTASHLPEFKKRVKHFIPIFLQMRLDMYPNEKFKSFEYYFPTPGDLDSALNQLFYLSARDFVKQHFKNIKFTPHAEVYNGWDNPTGMP